MKKAGRKQNQNMAENMWFMALGVVAHVWTASGQQCDYVVIGTTDTGILGSGYCENHNGLESIHDVDECKQVPSPSPPSSLSSPPSLPPSLPLSLPPAKGTCMVVICPLAPTLPPCLTPCLATRERVLPCPHI